MLNGRELDPGTLHGNRLPLPGLRDDNELRVEADMAYSRGGAGLHRFTDVADGETYLALHAGLDNAQRVFAAFDQPDLKAAITATVVAPGSWAVLGNGVARLASFLAIHCHFSGKDQRLGLFPRFDQALTQHGHIEPLFHALRCTMKSAIWRRRSARSSNG